MVGRGRQLTTRLAAPPTYVSAPSSSDHESACANVCFFTSSNLSRSTSDDGTYVVSGEREKRRKKKKVGALCTESGLDKTHRTFSRPSLHRIPDGYDSVLARLRGSDAMLSRG